MSHGHPKKKQRGLAQCPSCDTQFAAPIAAAGKAVRCKTCDQRFTLPSAQEMFEDAVAYIVEREESDRSREAFASASREIQHEAIRNADIG